MNTKIKLCGMFRDCDIDYINEAKPDFAGFIINFPKSHRSITLERAAELRKRLSPDISAVGVFVNEPPTTCAEMSKCGIIDIIQLHGSESAEYIRQLRALTDAPIIKAVKVTSADDIRRAQTLGADYLLLDNGAGTGQMFDHSLINPSEINVPFFLAGGLTPENVAETAKRFSPYAVDMSGGIETDRKKDREKILAAVDAVRKA